jgi:hypothetical protein
MDRFVRRTFGLVALFALFVSLAHTVWALCCIGDAAPFTFPMLFSEAGSEPVAPLMHPVSHHIASTDTAQPLTLSSHPASPHGPAPYGPLHECPHGQAGVMGGCAVAAAIPTGMTTVAAIPFGNQVPVRLSDTLPRILFGTDLFRPPRA